MPKCVKCNSNFPNSIRIDGKCKNLNHRKYCLVCSPYGQHNTKRLELDSHPNEKFCSWCSKTKPRSEFYGRTNRNDISCYCKVCSDLNNKILMRERATIRKLKLIKFLGGCCTSCGYNKHSAALNFHHKDKSTKSFGLSVAVLRAKSWEECLKEANKCILLCSNCHAELHNTNLFSSTFTDQFSASDDLIEPISEPGEI